MRAGNVSTSLRTSVMDMLQAAGPEPDLEGGGGQLPEPGAAAEPAAGGQPSGVRAHGGALLTDSAGGTVSFTTLCILERITLPSTGCPITAATITF